jgi:Domain of unknown function (DUF4258)
MNKKSFPYIFLVLLLVVLAAVHIYRKSTRSGSETKQEQQDTKRKQPAAPPSDNPNRTEGFNRRAGSLIYTKHARCRMGCRHIDESEVMEILEKGTINYGKSELKNTRGPKYALEGITHDNQRVRIVFAQDTEGTAVVTVIDLGKEWECHCE